MVQGTSSSVGKSLVVTALCRILSQDGWRVAPFKAQNMALNSFVTLDGGEMGRSQVTQAEAAGVDPSVDMNPILLKPEADSRCQVVVLGRPWKTVAAGDYYQHTSQLLKTAMSSLLRLQQQFDVVVIEGAGGPAEVNLKRREIANMRIARLANCPVLLVGDIERGGLFASIVGTLALLSRTEKALVQGIIVNKFRGDLSILQPGLTFLERRTRKPVLGVIPYAPALFLPEEDSLREEGERRKTPGGRIDIAVIALPRISNATDFEALEQEPDVCLRYVRQVGDLGQPDIIILPGTKSTVADLAFLRRSGLAAAIAAGEKQGTGVIGICGGFQMLGRSISDPQHVESENERVEGLSLLPVDTVFQSEKATRQVQATVAASEGFLAAAHGSDVTGYEIHMGRSYGEGVSPAFVVRSGGSKHADGAVARGGKVVGTYLHGLFDNAGLRGALLDSLRRQKGLPALARGSLLSRRQQYDRLADLVRHSLDIPRIYGICGLRRRDSTCDAASATRSL